MGREGRMRGRKEMGREGEDGRKRREGRKWKEEGDGKRR